MLNWFIRLNRTLSRKFSDSYRQIVIRDNYKGKLIDIIKEFIETRTFTHILEAGGIDRPLLRRYSNTRYDGVDIEIKDQCHKVYDDFLVQSIEEPLDKKYDVICSFTLLEHVQDNTRSFNVMFDGLKAGGIMVHYVPSKYHPYSIIARMLGHVWSARILNRMHPQTEGLCGYQTYFHKCSVRQMGKLAEKAGFSDIEIIPYYRANTYFEIFFPLFIAVTLWENLCKKLNWSMFCSGFIINAKKIAS